MNIELENNKLNQFERNTKQEKLLLEILSCKPSKPFPTILFSDPNKDPDDLGAFMVAGALNYLKIIDLKSIIATLGTDEIRVKRACFTKGIFETLGLNNIDVAVGQPLPIGPVSQSDMNVYIENNFESDPSKVSFNPQASISKVLQEAEDHSVLVIVIAGMTDLSKFLSDKNNQPLFKRKVRQVTIMGGALLEDNELIPNLDSYNHRVDILASQNVIKRVSSLEVPLRFISKKVAYAAPVAPDFFSDIANLNHPVGEYLAKVQEDAIKKHWRDLVHGEKCHFSIDKFFLRSTDLSKLNPQHASIIEKLISEAIDHQNYGSVLDYVTKLNQYDPFTILGAIPEIVSLFFNVESGRLKDNVELIADENIYSNEKSISALSLLQSLICQFSQYN